MESLTKERYLTAIQDESAALARASRQNLHAPVRSCPGWYAATLVAHIGEVQRFWAYTVRTRAQMPGEMPADEFDSCPGLLVWQREVEAGVTNLDSIPQCLVEWMEESTRHLLDAFAGTAPEDVIWHWSGDNRGITHMRNQAMEATVHRWDAENAQGGAAAIPADIAVDGIRQHFEVQISAARYWGKSTAGTGERYHFHRTDGPGEWLVTFQGDEVAVQEVHEKGDIAVRGTAENLFLWLWGRISSDRLEVKGDANYIDRYRRLVPSST